MKEAAGEANMTVITIILIGIVLAIGAVIMQSVMSNISKNAEEASEGTYHTNVNGTDYGKLPG